MILKPSVLCLFIDSDNFNSIAILHHRVKLLSLTTFACVCIAFYFLKFQIAFLLLFLSLYDSPVSYFQFKKKTLPQAGVAVRVESGRTIVCVMGDGIYYRSYITLQWYFGFRT